MADIRELIILNPGALDARPETPLVRRLADLRMALRRAVVVSARVPLIRRAYAVFYRFHLWVAVQLSKRFAGTRAVYLSSGMATGDVHIGVSDIDLAIYGDWPENLQFRLMKIFGLLIFVSPLFDRMSLASIGTIDDVRSLCATDMTMALTQAKGARGWKLLYGEPMLAMLPAIAPERFPGCAYMEIRRWWHSLSTITLGSDVTSRDTIFRNSISFKAAAETLRAESMLRRNELDTTRRRILIEEELGRHEDPMLRLLLNSADRQYLEIETDPREPMLHWFLGRAEQFHEELRSAATFRYTKPVIVTGIADERMIAAKTMTHVSLLVEQARRDWTDLRAAFLAPCISMFSPDSLSLLFEVDGDHMPSLQQLQQLCAEHLEGASRLPQRLAIYLLLPNAAYQLDAKGALEFFHYTYLPEANPDVFLALSNADFVLYGQPRTPVAHAGWSPFAQELVLEELQARRGAHVRFGLASRPSTIENLRNFWRFLQLLVIEHSFTENEVILPNTVAATRRALSLWHPESDRDVQSLQHFFELAFQGRDANATELESTMQRVYAIFTRAE
jgi:hypothetical protein